MQHVVQVKVSFLCPCVHGIRNGKGERGEGGNRIEELHKEADENILLNSKLK